MKLAIVHLRSAFLGIVLDSVELSLESWLLRRKVCLSAIYLTPRIARIVHRSVSIGDCLDLCDLRSKDSRQVVSCRFCRMYDFDLDSRRSIWTRGRRFHCIYTFSTVSGNSNNLRLRKFSTSPLG